jgi:hypothetical protein
MGPRPELGTIRNVIHSRCRVNGVVQTAIPPLHMMRSLVKHSVTAVHCRCISTSQAAPSPDLMPMLAAIQRVLDIRFVDFVAIRRQYCTRLSSSRRRRFGATASLLLWSSGRGEIRSSSGLRFITRSAECSGAARYEDSAVSGALFGLWIGVYCG